MDTASDSVKEYVPSRYSLVVLAAKRAKQLKEGAPALIHTESTNSLTIALEEIAAGKINYIEVAERSDDEAPAGTAAIAPVIPSAIQMLTDTFDEAERAAHFADDGPGLDDDSDGEIDANVDEQSDADDEINSHNNLSAAEED